MNGFTELTVDNYVPQPCLFENVLIDLTQQYDKLVFVALRKRCHCEERSDVAIPRLKGTR